MNRTINTEAELDALPVGSVVVEGDHTTPDEGSFLGITTIPGVFHRFPDGWYVVAGYGERAPEEILPATVLHDPSASEAPSATREDVARALVPTLDEWWCGEHVDYHATDDEGDDLPCCVAERQSQGQRQADALLARFTITPRTDR